MGGSIIILHGPSSSGKSTIAAALQELADSPFWHVSIDHLRDAGVLPNRRIERRDFNWSELRRPVFDGFHRSLRAYAEAGNNLIVEHIFDTPGWPDDLKKLLAPFDVVFVGVHCSLEELNRREAVRGDRPIGDAERDFHRVHLGRTYDLEVDGKNCAAKNAQTILTYWRSDCRKSEFSVGT